MTLRTKGRSKAESFVPVDSSEVGLRRTFREEKREDKLGTKPVGLSVRKPAPTTHPGTSQKGC